MEQILALICTQNAIKAWNEKLNEDNIATISFQIEQILVAVKYGPSFTVLNTEFWSIYNDYGSILDS